MSVSLKQLLSQLVAVKGKAKKYFYLDYIILGPSGTQLLKQWQFIGELLSKYLKSGDFMMEFFLGTEKINDNTNRQKKNRNTNEVGRGRLDRDQFYQGVRLGHFFKTKFSETDTDTTIKE